MEGAELNEVFAKRVRELAGERGWSVNYLADFAGLGRGFVSELLRGKKSPTLETVAKVATALEVDAWKLLKADEARTRTRRR